VAGVSSALKEYEVMPEASEAMIYVAMMQRMLARLA
jgi:hypothetical protein